MNRRSSSCLLGLGLLFAGILQADSADLANDNSSSSSAPRPSITDWHSVESEEYLSYVRNLQAVGCPPQTIKTVVTADVTAAFAGRRAEAVAVRYQDFKYWQANAAETGARAKLSGQQRAIDEEMNRALQQLLGPDADLPDVSREWQREKWNHELSFLAPDKREATKVVLQEYAKVNQQMGELAAGMNLTEDTNELQSILVRYQKEQSALQQLLSPEEYQLAEMTFSWTAENLRHAMVHFEPTQEEFRIIFQAWQPHDDKLSQIHATRQPDPGSLEKEVFAKIQAQLSASRYQQYRDTWWK